MKTVNDRSESEMWTSLVSISDHAVNITLKIFFPVAKRICVLTKSRESQFPVHICCGQQIDVALLASSH